MIFISLGANLNSPVGEPVVTLRAALESFASHDVKVVLVSPFYRSIAWPKPADPVFVNAVAAVQTELEPAALLSVLHGIEAKFGRLRRQQNAPRTLDLDLIDYRARVEPGPPELPHPRMETRAFVLLPLRDVAPDWRHPVSKKPIAELIKALPKGLKMPEELGF